MTMLSASRVVWLMLFAATVLVTESDLQAAEPVDYSTQIKPILASRCFRCHGAVKQEGRLRLDTAAAMRLGGEHGAAIVAGKVEGNLLLKRVRAADDSERMPPEGDRLTAEQIDLLQRWIESGAAAPTDEAPQKNPKSHWAFQTPRRSVMPKSDLASTNRNPIDQFLAATRATQRIVSLPTASKSILLRRVFVDLIGVPPSADELREFLADESPDAYENVVERLLSDSRYGERWARHWMDVWRYSDWDGYAAEVRESKPHIWRWRDWIVESLNSGKPYDRMLVEMLAADEVAPDDPDALRATGFLVRHWFRYNRNVWLDNAVEHTGKAFLGLTFNCAKCHDHMYDPLSQPEYFQLRAFFEPYDVRTDRLPGEPDRDKFGLVRAFDANATQPTFLFVRGDEAQPVKDKPLPPALPSLFNIPTDIQPVSLPATAYYPGLQAFIQAEERQKVRQQLARAEQDLAAAHKNLAVSKSLAVAAIALAPVKLDPDVLLADARFVIKIAERNEHAAQRNVQRVEAVIAADLARFGSSSDDAVRRERAEAAARASRQHVLAIAEVALLEAERAVEKGRQNLKPDDAKSQKTLADAEAALKKQQTARDEAAKTAEQVTDQYDGLSSLHPPTSTGRRSTLARWIASRDNPLTARVAVNHIWMRHFGEPLVASVFDFGLNGKSPTHPELLDWLAVEFMDSGWDQRHLHRLMLLSDAYRLASSTPDASELAKQNSAIDPENRTLWRFNPRRLEAEAVRDATLHVAGSLEHQPSGPELDPDLGLTSGRRSLYFRSSKEKRMTFTALFDGPNVSECYRRSESIAPQQALAMANSGLTLAQSRILAGKLADRALNESTTSDRAWLNSSPGRRGFVSLAFEHLLNRNPTDVELAECETFLGEQSQSHAEASKQTRFKTSATSSVPPSTDAAQRARENLIHVLLNHHEFVTVR